MDEKEKTKKPKTKTAAKPKKPAKITKRKPNAAFMAPVQPDGLLAAVVGAEPQPRTEITKKLWEYIKANDLQDAIDKRQINCDEKLRDLFGVQQIQMFDMNRELLKHIRK